MPDPAGTSLMGVVARFDGVQRFTVLMRVVSQNGAVITKGWVVVLGSAACACLPATR